MATSDAPWILFLEVELKLEGSEIEIKSTRKNKQDTVTYYIPTLRFEIINNHLINPFQTKPLRSLNWFPPSWSNVCMCFFSFFLFFFGDFRKHITFSLFFLPLALGDHCKRHRKSSRIHRVRAHHWTQVHLRNFWAETNEIPPILP